MRAALEAFGVAEEGDKFDSRNIKQHVALLIALTSKESGKSFPWTKETLVHAVNNATKVWYNDAKGEWDRKGLMFPDNDLAENLEIVREDGIATVTLYGVKVTVGTNGAPA